MILKAEASDNLVELSVVEVSPPVLPYSLGGDRRILTRVEIDGFTARTTDWIGAAEWTEFVAQLEALERRRAGEAWLQGLSPDQLRLRFFALDRAGHLAVAGQVGRRMPTGGDCRLAFADVRFEGSQLLALVAELRAAVSAA
jgi:hypothetical protein